MSANEAAALLAELERRRKRRAYCPHTPHPRQREFLELTCVEALFGGAAGGGKSDALLMDALRYVHVPGYSALLLRRTYTDLSLPGAIMSRSHEWLSGTDATWNGTEKRWTFPSGATLTFGYLDTEKDRFRYQGAELQFIGFDELTQFPEGWYRYLFSRLRRLKTSDVPIRMRAATNPGGIGHEWVRRRFLSGEDGAPPFIPSRLEDNPSLDAEEYRASLERLDATTRKQLLEGVWLRDAGGLVYQVDPDRNVVTLAPDAPPFDAHVLAVDFGYTDSTGFALLAWRAHEPRVYVLRTWKVARKTPSEIGETIRELEERYKFDAIVGDVGGLGKGYAEEARRRFAVPIEPAEKQNKRGYIDLLNGALQHGELVFVRGANAPVLAEMAELPWNDDRSAEVEGFENHCADAVLYGWRKCVAYTEVPRERQIARDSEEWERREEERLAAEIDARAGLEWWQVGPDGEPL